MDDDISRRSRFGSMEDLDDDRRSRKSSSSLSRDSFESEATSHVYNDIEPEWREVVAGIDVLARDLHTTMETILSNSMVTDIVAGTYKAHAANVDIGAVVASIRVTNRIVITPNTFSVMADSQLLRHILMNALSNAAKYGAQGEQIDVIVRLKDEEEKTAMIFIDVVNKPGPEHHNLVALDDTSIVFHQGRRLHGSFIAASVHERSSGDGAWIMQKCAAALGGECRISFDASKTTFSVVFPAEIPPRTHRISDAPAPVIDFVLPLDAHLIAIDDSAAQRRLLRRFFSKMCDGQRKAFSQQTSTIKIFGADSVDSFVSDVVNIVEHRSDKFAVFLDNHLSYDCDNGSTVVASGIELGKDLRKQLSDLGLLDRVLLIMRTADDSETTFDHFPKRPMGVDAFRNELGLRWRAYFHDDSDDDSNDDLTKNNLRDREEDSLDSRFPSTTSLATISPP